MSKVIKYLPELEDEEQLYIAKIFREMTEEQAENFTRVYRERRKDGPLVLMLSLLGLLVVAGVHRFYLGQIGMGILYLLTGGLCVIGTIVDAVNYKKLAWKYNKEQADQVAELIMGAFPAQLEE